MRRFLFPLLAAIALPVPAAQSDYPFAVTTEQMGTHYRVLAKNNGPSPVAVRISLSMPDGVASDRTLPVTVTVQPGRALPVGNVFAATKGSAFRFGVSASWILGDLQSSHDPGAVYRLPFAEGSSFPISQAFDGPITTHDKPDSQYAVDFTMPAGTLVLAAREGVVIRVESGFTEGGQDPALLGKSNEVAVLHKDGTMAIYAHLGPGRQLVTLGQRVQAGDSLGFSGNTGFSSGAHLHFAVVRAIAMEDGMPAAESLPFTFYAFNPPKRFAPRAGMMALSEYGKPEALPMPKPKHATRAEAAGAQVVRAEDSPQPPTLTFAFAPLLRMKVSLDEWLGSSFAGWAALVAPVMLMMWFGLAPAGRKPVDIRREPTVDRDDR